MMNLYHKLLEIPESESPPDHYGLLGVSRFTDDAQVIHGALVTRSTQLRSWDNSKFYLEANALLDEVVAASFILEDPIKKAAYDTELRQRLGLSEAKPVALAALVKFVETPTETKVFVYEEVFEYEEVKEPDEEPLHERLARLAKPLEAGRTPHGKESSSAGADDSETNFDGLFLKLGGGLVVVTLLIAVPVVMWTGRKADSVARPNQTTADTLQSPQPRAKPAPQPAPDPDWERTRVTFSIPSDVPTPLPDLIADRLKQQQVEINFSRTPLEDAFRVIADGCKVRIDIDGDALKAAGFTRNMPQTLKLGKVTGLEAIAGILKRYEKESVPLVLVIDELKQVARITTKEFADKDRLVITDSETGSPLSGSPPSSKRMGNPKAKTRSDWDAENVHELAALTGHTGPVYTVVFSPDGKRLASASSDQTVKVWDAASGQETLTLKGHTGPVTSVAFSADGKRLASAGDTTVKVWDATSGQEMLTLKGHTNSVTSVAFSPDGTRIVSASYDKSVKLWDVATGQDLMTGEHGSFVCSVAFSPDGARFASACEDGRIVLWDASTGRATQALKGHPVAVVSVVFSPDGKRLASASLDQTVKVWDATSGQQTLTLKGHTGVVTNVAFSPDGKRLASADYYDKTVKVWDATSGQELLTLKGHTHEVTSVAFNSDGKRLASASHDKTIRLWGTGPPLKLPPTVNVAGAATAGPIHGAIGPAVNAPAASGKERSSAVRKPASQLGAPEYPTEKVVLHLSVGEPSGLEECISSKCKGLLVDVRDGRATDAQLDDLKKLFEGWQTIGRPRTQDGFWYFSGRNLEGTTINFKVKKEDATYKVIEMTVIQSSTAKPKQPSSTTKPKTSF